ncbi:uncharacterized protein LOC135936285 [Cloeon dipterum]|uniref:uncharacterized protein LOC135936285 n=1 Tax=Cloeon dipterum TaxID=197152 RepID=UPI00321FA4CB
MRAYALPNDSFLHLRELAFEPDESSNGALLSSVLCAPKLERFMLSFRRAENLDMEDLERISVWVEEQQILTNLTHFQLASHPTVLNAEFCRAFSDFTRNASAFLPKLARFDAMFRLSCVDVRHFMAEGEEDVVCTDRDRQLTAEKFAQFGEHKYVQFLNAYKRN